MNKNDFFPKPFLEKTYIDISICKSNIKENTSYAKPCLSGFVKSDELIKKLKKKAPFVNETIMSAALEELSNLILTLLSEGKTVQLFSLGSLSLGSKGSVEVEEGAMSYLQDESEELAMLKAKRIADATSGGYNLDVSSIIKTKPKFTLKFEQSQKVKKALENMEVNVAIKKKRAPTIAQITNIVKNNKANAQLPTILKIKGEDLKVMQMHKEDEPSSLQKSGTTEVGANEASANGVGIYIEESGSGKMKKLVCENIIKNTPSELVIILDEKLKDSKRYNLIISTQYVKMGKRRVGHLLRSTKVCFRADEIEVKKASSRLKKALVPLESILPSRRKTQDIPINLRLKKWENRELNNRVYALTQGNAD